jgi:hypothetical protein
LRAGRPTLRDAFLMVRAGRLTWRDALLMLRAASLMSRDWVSALAKPLSERVEPSGSSLGAVAPALRLLVTLLLMVSPLIH